jgi:hypothetical protein
MVWANPRFVRTESSRLLDLEKTRIVVFCPGGEMPRAHPTLSATRDASTPAAVAIRPPENDTAHLAPAATPIAQVGPSSARRHDPARAFQQCGECLSCCRRQKDPRGPLRARAAAERTRATTPHWTLSPLSEGVFHGERLWWVPPRDGDVTCSILSSHFFLLNKIKNQYAHDIDVPRRCATLSTLRFSRTSARGN